MKEKKVIYTGIIEQDEAGNFFCGSYLLDYKYTVASFKIGNKITIKSIAENPSDMSYDKYQKSQNYFS
ncbi:MAG TPA: hypothetical protein DDZ41_04585 [Flavobacterium sp.]|nr:hypothetical protein [Flavobacterium sp.]